MGSGEIWVLVGVGLGLLLTIGLVVFAMLRRRNLGATAPEEMSADRWFALGVVFTGAGVALMASIGPQMAFMLAIGLIYMVIGARMKRRQPK